VLRDWWAAEDAAKFETQAARLGAQYDAVPFPQLPGLHIISRMTMGENIADLGGILLALDAYKVSLNGQPAPVLDGFTGQQRVFSAGVRSGGRSCATTRCASSSRPTPTRPA
jgi:putative endopeptidase